MNERIQELAEQANIHFSRVGILDGDSNGSARMVGYSKMEKFAELIVQECMRMCDVAAVGYETHGHTKEANGCDSAKEYIEEHFGVKE